MLPFPGDNAGLSCGTIPVQDQAGNTIGNAVRLYNNDEFTQPNGLAFTPDESALYIGDSQASLIRRVEDGRRCLRI